MLTIVSLDHDRGEVGEGNDLWCLRRGSSAWLIDVRFNAGGENDEISGEATLRAIVGEEGVQVTLGIVWYELRWVTSQMIAAVFRVGVVVIIVNKRSARRCI